jgi:alpha-L-fucosidase
MRQRLFPACVLALAAGLCAGGAATCAKAAPAAVQTGQGGGDLNPGLSTDAESLRRFQDAKIGLSIHWGPSCQGGYEISWARGKEIPKQVYDNYYKTFNPVKFDAHAWCQMMKDCGIRYAVPTGKHHGGFAMWFSKLTPYNIKNTPFHRDIMKELGDACRKQGIIFCSYYSNIDWYHPDWPAYGPGGPGALIAKQADSPNMKRYLDFMRGQCTELIRDYGVEFIQFDGEWDGCWTHQIGSQMYRDLHTMFPKVLLSGRVDVGRRQYIKDPQYGLIWDRKIYAGDIEERERVVNANTGVYGYAPYPWQAWVTIDKTQWSYNPRPTKRLMKPEEVIRDMISVICDGGNYEINLGPSPEGIFDPVEERILRQAGKWFVAHGEAIYGTRGGPYHSGRWGGSTYKDKSVFLYVTDASVKRLVLPLPGSKVLKAVSLADGNAVPLVENEKTLELDLTAVPRDSICALVKLELARPVSGMVAR